MTTNPYQSPENESHLPKQQTDWLGPALRIVILLGLLGLLLLMVMPRWPLGGAREAARRSQCSNNLRNIALALQNYESTYGSLPPAYTIDATGKPLHSWRTLILPFLEQKSLYDQIDLSKPWNDPANRIAHQISLKIYDCPSSTAGKGKTTYFAVVGSGACFKPTEPRPVADITDNRDLTLMVIEVAEKHAAHWMSPNDAGEALILNRAADRKPPHPKGGFAACASGTVRFLNATTPTDVLRALISVDGHDDDIAILAD